MFKNRNKWFYAFIVATALLVAAAVAIVVISVNRPQPQVEIQIPEGAETGVYYYSVEQGEVILSLNNGNKFTMAGTGMNRSGTYTVDGQNVAFTFVTGSDVATAVLGDNVVTVTFNGNVMTFLKQVNYTVSFDTNGGEEIASVQVLNGKNFAAPANPVKDGYVFIGWYADAACKTAYQFTNAVSGDTTVYAGWVKKEVGAVEFAANFDLGYENAEQLPQMNTINGKLYNLPTPEREGYTFGGWFISMYEDGQKLTAMCNEDTVLTADATLFAVWHEKSGSKLVTPDVSVTATGLKWNAVEGASAYQVKIVDAEGNVHYDNSMGATSMNFDFAALQSGDYVIEVVAVANNTANNSDATVRYFRNKALDRVSKFQVINGMLIFNAVENAENYLITIDCGNKDHNHDRLNNGNSTVYNFSNCYMQEGGIRFTVVATAKGYADSVAQTFVYERSLAAIENLQFDSKNDQFIWDVVENAAGYVVTVTVGEETYVIETGYHNYFSTAPYTGEISVAVVPVTAGYNSPAAATASCSKTAPAAPKNVRVDGMVITWDAVEGATKYEVKIGSVTYEVDTNSVDLIEKKFDASVGQNYTILVKAIVGSEGSSYSQGLTVQYKSMDSQLAYNANKVFWTPVLGGTNFDVRINGGEVFRVSGVNYAPILLTKAGINVIEVRCADLSSNEWMTLEVFAYEVTYYSRTLAGEKREYVAIGDSLNMPQDYTNEGYNFAGWYNTPGAANGNGMEYTSNVFTGNGNMALYANWSPKQYDIVFNVDGNVSNITNESSEKVTYTKHFALTPAETDNPALGYFVGWYTAPGGGGVQITDSLGNSVAPYDVIGTTHVYPYFANALSYELLSDGTYAVKQGPGIANKNVSEIVIPATYNEKPVTQILDNGFLRCSNIVSVKLPDTITRIGIGAFDICNNLESIEVYVVDPNSTTQKFYSSSNGALLYFDEASGNTYLEFFPRAKTGTYTVPEEVDNIRPYAFKYSKIEKVIISKGVTMVSESAFYQCTKLHTIEFEFGREESVTITVGAFDGLTRVETLILPAKLNVIEDLKTLDKLEALKTIIVEAGGENYSASSNLLCDGAGTALLYVPNSFAGVFEAPMGIQTIGDSVFAGKASITEVIIPAYVRNIGVSAFEGCGSITRVTVNGPRNDDLTIGENAFAGCALLDEITFEGGTSAKKGVITIGTRAFAACEVLDKMNIGDNVVIGLIGDYAFSKNISLNELNFSESAEILSIGSYAFEQCLGIKAYVVHASTVSVGDYAFSGCSYLEVVEFAPNGGEVSFGQGVFQDCVRLTTIRLPATLSGFDGSVFDGCEHINNIEVDPANPYLETFGGALYTMGRTELVYYPRELTGDLSGLPWDTLTKIGPAVFKSNPKVTSVTIGAGITEIGAGAFDSCINLTSVTFAKLDGAMVIGDNAFAGCTQIAEISLPAQTTSIGAKAFYMTKLSVFTIPETVTSIGAQAFAYTNLSTIRIPAAVTYIGQGAFYQAVQLNSITFVGGTEDLVLGEKVVLPETEEEMKAFDGNGMFVGTKLTTVALPANVSFIGDYTFHGLTTLTEAAIPADSRLTHIGRNAFYKTGITSINLVEGVRELDEYAFALTKLTTVTIPSTMEHIRAYALSTSTLTQILFTEGNPEVGLSIYNHAFVGTRITEITLPAHLNMIGERNEEYMYRMVWDVFHQTSKIPTGMSNNTGLTKVHVTEGGKYYGSKDGILYEKSETGEMIDLLFCPAGNTGDIVVPNTVIHVQHSAFMKSQLNSIVFEEFDKEDPRYGTQILSIGDWSGTAYGAPAVFGGEGSSSYQTPLTLIQLPSHLKSVSSRAFTGLDKPSSGAKLVVEFNPDATVFFDQACMRNNSSIKTLHLPKVESMALQSFYGLSNMTELTFAPGTTAASIPDRCFESCGVENFVLPASITSIGSAAFRSAKLKTLTQEEGGALDSIGAQAFSGCNNMVNFKILDTVTIVGDAAFENCSNLETLEISINMQSASGIIKNCSKLTAVIVAEDHPYLMSDDGVLYDKQQTILFLYPEAKGPMTKSIPETVHTIDGYAFYRYQGSTIQLPENLRFIGSYAFQYSKLASIHIPAKVQTIGNNAFADIGTLTAITFAENASLRSIGSYGFNGNYATEIILPDSLESIGDYCFSASRKLQTLVVGAGMRTIGGYAFNSCGELTSITLQEGLQTINSGAFQNTTSLPTITIPDTVTTMGNYVFSGSYGAPALESVLMSEHSQLRELGNNVFYKMSNLKKVTFGDMVEKVGTTIFKDSTALEEVRLSNAMPEVGDELFKGCANLRIVNIPASAKRIGNSAFEGCSSVTEITISVDVTEIGTNAFSGCTSLAVANIDSGSTLKVINDGAFENTISLATIKLPVSVISIGNAAFKNSAIDNAPLGVSLKRIGDEAFYNCVNMTSVSIPSSVTNVGRAAFYGCANVETLTMTTGLKNIGDLAFAGMVKLTEVNIPETVAFMGANPFANCTGLTSITIDDANESFVYRDGILFDKTMYTLIYYPSYRTDATYEIPASVYEIAGGAFSGSQLESIIIPESIKAISESAFENSKKLASIVIPESVTIIGKNAFKGCEKLDNVTIPASVTELGEAAFSGCASLTTVTLAERKVDIVLGAHLFENCVKLTEQIPFPNMTAYTDYMYANTGIVNLVIPETIIDLQAKGVFANCAKLRTVQFPSGVSYTNGRIGGRFFYNCTALQSIHTPSGIQYFGSPRGNTIDTSHIMAVGEVFANCTNLTTVVMDSFNGAEIGLFENCTKLTSVQYGSNNFTIGQRMFAGCTALNNLSFMASAYAIETEAFAGCTGLTGEITLPNRLQLRDDMFTGCTNISKLIVGTVESITDYAFRGLTANTTVYFKSYKSADKIPNIGKGEALVNTEAKIEFKKDEGGSSIDYSLTEKEMGLVEKFCGNLENGKELMDVVAEKLVEYKKSFMDFNPGKELTKEEQAMFMTFCDENKIKMDEKMMGEIFNQWVEYKQTLAAWLKELYALTTEEQTMVEEFCSMLQVDKGMFETVQNALMAYKATFNDSISTEEVTKEEQEQLRMFLESLGVKAEEKVLGEVNKTWLTYKQQLAAANKPAAKSYLTEKEMEELNNLLSGKLGLEEDVINAIAAAWSNYKLNFTETKADKEISKEEYMALTEFLNGLGLDEKMANMLLEDYFRDGMAQFKMQMAERNAKAEVTKEEIEMIDTFVKEMGLAEDASKILQEKLFNYKRLFSETEPSKELTDEEIEILTALIEELGGKVDEKVIEKLGMQWIDYKMGLIKSMGM